MLKLTITQTKTTLPVVYHKDRFKDPFFFIHVVLGWGHQKTDSLTVMLMTLCFMLLCLLMSLAY